MGLVRGTLCLKEAHFTDRLGSYWLKTLPLPIGYDKFKERKVLEEWGGLKWDEDEGVERVYICYKVSKNIRRDILTKVMVVADLLAKHGDPQARSYPIDYYISYELLK